MKIQLHSLAAGPAGVLHPGIRDVSPDVAKPLIDGGYAVSLGKPEPEPATPTLAVERATAPAPERAVLNPPTARPKPPKAKVK